MQVEIDNLRYDNQELVHSLQERDEERGQVQALLDRQDCEIARIIEEKRSLERELELKSEKLFDL